MTLPISKFLTNPKTILAGMLLGIALGTYYKPLVPYLAPIGDSYKSLLIMCIVPIIFNSIVLSLVNIFKHSAITKKLGKLALAFILCTLLTAGVAMLVILLTKNHIGIGIQAQNTIAATIQATENYTGLATEATQNTTKLAYFLQNITPSNVFAALTEGLTSKIILLALLIGVALGKNQSKQSRNLISFFNITNDLFQKIFHWVLTLAPIGLLGIFAASADNFNSTMLLALLKIVIAIHIIMLILVAFYSLVIRFTLKIPYRDVLSTIKKPLVLACATISATVAIPDSIKSLSTLPLEKQMVELTVPLGIAINRQGNILLLISVALFSLIFYNIPLTFTNISMIILISALIGSSSHGASMAFLPIFALIASTIGIPSIMGTTIILSTDLFVSWALIFVTLFSNYAATIVLSKEKNNFLTPQNTAAEEV